MKLLPVLLVLAVSCCGPTEVSTVVQALDAGASPADAGLRGPLTNIPPGLGPNHPICGDCSALP